MILCLYTAATLSSDPAQNLINRWFEIITLNCWLNSISLYKLTGKLIYTVTPAEIIKLYARIKINVRAWMKIIVFRRRKIGTPIQAD